MFRGGQTNAYDDIVAKTTDENLTSENWELILNLCDKVSDEGEQGARNVIAAVLKRLTHRNANVQLYALSLSDSLAKNCGVHLHREMASKAFTSGLEKLVADRTSHDKVKQRALALVAEWTHDFQKDPSLGMMEECYNNLKAKNYKFTPIQEPPPPEVDDAVRRKEEEELQRVLAMSMQDKGGRSQWSNVQGSSSNPGSSSAGTSGSSKPVQSSSSRYSPPPASSGYVPAQQGPPRADAYTPAPAVSSYSAAPSAIPVATPAPTAMSQPAAAPAPDAPIPIVTRVRALHAFEPTEPGELAFEKGDMIKVVDRGYKDWWRGQLKGRTGIFPVNYVEPLPEPTGAQLAQEAQQEAAVFSQAANVDKLLTLLREFDGGKDNLADNEDIQELYRSTISLRPKIVKLIDKYSQKRADLVSMNESFVKAKSIYERMMDQSLARIAENSQDSRPLFQPTYSYGPQPGAPQPYGYPQGAPGAQPVYGGYPQGPQGPQGPQPQGQQQQQQQQAYAQPYGQQQPGPSYPAYGGTPAPHMTGTPGPYPAQAQGPVQPSQTPNPQFQQQPHGYSQAANTPYPDPQQQQQQQQQPQPHQPLQQQAQGQPQMQPQQQPQQQPQTQPQGQVQAQAHPQSHAPSQQQSGPPYVYDPNGIYPDENATAWARYYAQGGTDPTGAAYFLSVPGIKEAAPAGAAPATAQQQADLNTSLAQQPAPAHGQPVQVLLQRHDTAGSVATVTGYQPQQPHGPSQSNFPQDPAMGYQAGAPTSPTGASGFPDYSSPAGQQGHVMAAMPSAAPGPYAPNPVVGGAVYPPAGPEAGPGSSPSSPWTGQQQGLVNSIGSMSLGPSQPQPSAA